LVSVVTVSGEVAPEVVRVVPPSLDAHVAVKPVIVLPPFPFAVNATIAELDPRVTPVSDGAAGTVPATKELDAAEAALLAIEFAATTLHVYVRPFDSEATVMGEVAPVVPRVRPPLLERQVAR